MVPKGSNFKIKIGFHLGDFKIILFCSISCIRTVLHNLLLNKACVILLLKTVVVLFLKLMFMTYCSTHFIFPKAHTLEPKVKPDKLHRDRLTACLNKVSDFHYLSFLSLPLFYYKIEGLIVILFSFYSGN